MMRHHRRLRVCSADGFLHNDKIGGEHFIYCETMKDFELYKVQKSNCLITCFTIFASNICLDPPLGQLPQQEIPQTLESSWMSQLPFELHIKGSKCSRVEQDELAHTSPVPIMEYHASSASQLSEEQVVVEPWRSARGSKLQTFQQVSRWGD